MTSTVSEDQWLRAGEIVACALGLHYPAERRRDLERGTVAAAAELGFSDPSAFLDKLLCRSLTKLQMTVLASQLTVGETYFFREPGHFAFLEKQVLLALIKARQGGSRHLRIWCAACCSGEEPYSIAILLRRLLPDVDQWNVTLLATDINPRFLEKAEAGIYGEWSFRNAPAWLKQQAFRERGEHRFEILPEIKRMVRFSQMNLAEDVFPALANDTNAMDVIFCRNVLMYFTSGHAHDVIAKLYRSQVEKGWLFVGPSELLHVSSSPYTIVKSGDTILYQKDSDRAQRRTMPVPVRADVAAEPLLQREFRHEVREAQKTVIASPIPPTPAEPAVGSEISDRLYAAACTLYEQGSYGEAIEKLAQMPSALPHGPVLRLRTRCLANQGRLGEALACCDAWISTDKLNASCHYVRAAILQEQNAVDDAVRSLRKAIYLDHDFVLAHFALGDIARRRGRSDEAARHFENTRKLVSGRSRDDVLPESDGITAGRLLEMLSSFSSPVEA